MGEATENFVRLAGHIRVSEAVSRLEGAPDTPYALIERSDGEFLLVSRGWLQDQLRATADRVGEAAVDLTLEQIPGLPDPCKPVEISMGMDEQQKRLRRSPGGATVVLEDGKPTKILVRRGITSGMPTGLFGRRYGLFEGDIVDDAIEPRQCPTCETTFDFYEPRVEDGELRFHCPHCGHHFEQM